MKKVKTPKHIHSLDREISKFTWRIYVGEWVTCYKEVHVWSCKKCPFLVKKEINYSY